MRGSAGREPLRAEGRDDLSTLPPATLPLHDLRIGRGSGIQQHLDLHRPDLGRHGLRSDAVGVVPAPVPWHVTFSVSEVHGVGAVCGPAVVPSRAVGHEGGALVRTKAVSAPGALRMAAPWTWRVTNRAPVVRGLGTATEDWASTRMLSPSRGRYRRAPAAGDASSDRLWW